MMKRIRHAALMACIFTMMMAVSGPARALISGEYKVTFETTLTPPNCKWIGTATMGQTGMNVSGNAVLYLDLTANPDPLCVSFFQIIQGPLTGTLVGTALNLTGTLGPYNATLIGTVVNDGLAASGTWTSSMVFGLRPRGIFAAELVLSAAPVFDARGMVALVLILFAVAAWSMRRMSRKGEQMRGTSALVVFAALVIPFSAMAQSEGDVRLVNGPSPNAGRVEVFHDGQWGTVCDDNFDQNAANVVCRQLGLPAATSFPCCASFGQGVDPIWMDGMNCTGAEGRLVDCPFNGFGTNDCSHSEDAGVVCGDLTAKAPTLGDAGLLTLIAVLTGTGAALIRRRRSA